MLTQKCKHRYPDRNRRCGHLTTNDSGFCYDHQDPECRKFKRKGKQCSYEIPARGSRERYQFKRMTLNSGSRCEIHPIDRYP